MPLGLFEAYHERFEPVRYHQGGSTTILDCFQAFLGRIHLDGVAAYHELVQVDRNRRCCPNAHLYSRQIPETIPTHSHSWPWGCIDV